MFQCGSSQPALTELIRGLKDPIKRMEGLDRGDILRDIRTHCAASGEGGTSIKGEHTSRGLLPVLFHFLLSKAYSPLFTDEGKAQLLGVNTHMQYGVPMRSHAHPQMYREQEIDEGIQVGIAKLN